MALHSYSEIVSTLIGVELTPSDVPAIEELIDEAEVLLAARVGSLSVYAAASQQRADLLRVVVRRMVHRVLRNPMAYKSETEGNYTYVLDTNNAKGVIEVTPEDVRDLLGARPGLSSYMGSMRLKQPDWSPIKRW